MKYGQDIQRLSKWRMAGGVLSSKNKYQRARDCKWSEYKCIYWCTDNGHCRPFCGVGVANEVQELENKSKGGGRLMWNPCWLSILPQYGKGFSLGAALHAILFQYFSKSWAQRLQRPILCSRCYRSLSQYIYRWCIHIALIALKYSSFTTFLSVRTYYSFVWTSDPTTWWALCFLCCLCWHTG